jgi:hypothetical protein
MRSDGAYRSEGVPVFRYQDIQRRPAVFWSLTGRTLKPSRPSSPSLMAPPSGPGHLRPHPTRGPVPARWDASGVGRRYALRLCDPFLMVLGWLRVYSGRRLRTNTHGRSSPRPSPPWSRTRIACTLPGAAKKADR